MAGALFCFTLLCENNHSCYNDIRKTVDSIEAKVVLYNIHQGDIADHISLEVKLQKGGTVMDVKVVLDWKTVAALGASVAGVILVVKLDGDAAETVSTHVVDAAKELAIAGNSNR